VLDGKKSFEIRLDEGLYREGDTLILREWDPDDKAYTGRTIEREIGLVVNTGDLLFWPKEDKADLGFQVMQLIEVPTREGDPRPAPEDYRPPINLKEERGGGVSPHRPNRKASIAKVVSGVEQRLASRDPGRAETPYPPFVMLCFALGKLLRYYNSVLTGRKPDPTEITEALDYLVMHEMKEWGNAK
jgi:hypothetical protein